MNINNSRKKVVAMTKGLLSFCMLGALPFVTGCSDTWDDHYDSGNDMGDDIRRRVAQQLYPRREGLWLRCTAEFEPGVYRVRPCQW